MTEEEKQARADNYSPTDYANLASATMNSVMELYSVMSRLPADSLREFANAEDDNGQTTWAVLALMNTTTMDLRRFTLGLGG